MSAEAVILAPVLVTLLLVTAGMLGLAHTRTLLQAASAAAARTGSLAPDPAAGATAARRTAGDTLTQSHASCASRDIQIDTRAFRPGGQVAVTVRCTRQVPILGATYTLSSTSRSPIDTYRQFPSGSSR